MERYYNDTTWGRIDLEGEIPPKATKKLSKIGTVIFGVLAAFSVVPSLAFMEVGFVVLGIPHVFLAWLFSRFPIMAEKKLAPIQAQYIREKREPLLRDFYLICEKYGLSEICGKEDEEELLQIYEDIVWNFKDVARENGDDEEFDEKVNEELDEMCVIVNLGLENCTDVKKLVATFREGKKIVERS